VLVGDLLKLGEVQAARELGESTLPEATHPPNAASPTLNLQQKSALIVDTLGHAR